MLLGRVIYLLGNGVAGKYLFRADNVCSILLLPLKGGLECKLMLMFCIGIVHTNLYNCIS